MRLAPLVVITAAVGLSLAAGAQAATPALRITAPLRVEATGAAGARISYRTNRSAACSPARTTRFATGSRVIIRCKAGRIRAQRTVYIVDTRPPVLSVQAQYIFEATSEQSSPALIVWARDIVSGHLAGLCTLEGGAALRSLAVGEHAVLCSARDTAGNKATARTKLRIVDTIAPSLIGMHDVQLEPAAQDIVSLEEALPLTALDLVSVPDAIDIDCNHDVDAPLADGTTHIQCTATDEAGNETTKQASVTLTRPDTTVDPDPVDPDPVDPVDPDPVDPDPIAQPQAVVDVTVPTVANQAVRMPAPNDTASWRLVGAPAAAVTVDTAAGSYAYQATGWSLSAQTSTGRVKENITVTTRQGARIWSWELAPGAGGAAPVRQADGSVTFAKGARIAAPLITDAAGSPLAITQPAWTVAGNTISLNINDGAYPLPYVIDPSTTYPSVAITSGPADWTAQLAGPKVFNFTTASDGPILEIICSTVFQSLTWDDINNTWVVQGPTVNMGSCSPTSTSYITQPMLFDGRYTVDVTVRNSWGTAYARRTFDVDSSPPTVFGIETDSYQTMYGFPGMSMPACTTKRFFKATGFGVSIWPRPRDDHSGMSHFYIDEPGIGNRTIAADAVGFRLGPYPAGDYTARINAVNRAGQQRLLLLAYSMDAAAPTVPTITQPAPDAVLPAGQAVSIRFNATDDMCLRHYTVQIHANTTQLASISPGPTVTGYWSVPGNVNVLNLTMAAGLYQFRVGASDMVAQGAMGPWQYFRVQ